MSLLVYRLRMCHSQKSVVPGHLFIIQMLLYRYLLMMAGKLKQKGKVVHFTHLFIFSCQLHRYANKDRTSSHAFIVHTNTLTPSASPQGHKKLQFVRDLELLVPLIQSRCYQHPNLTAIRKLLSWLLLTRVHFNGLYVHLSQIMMHWWKYSCLLIEGYILYTAEMSFFQMVCNATTRGAGFAKKIILRLW